ncbi:MAG TPA: TldD/PmbA family protein [Acidobacteriaceae bacterium]|nr:TldD/PmbA family protein [Acidobacteriaceae bacterium]
MTLTATSLSTAASKTDLQQLAVDVVERALRAGATEAEAVIREGDEFSTVVRLGQVETLKESGARGIGLRVFLGSPGSFRTANTSTSDFSEAGLAHLISGAIDLARVTSEDPFAGLPEREAMGEIAGDLDLFYEDVYGLPTSQRIDYARRAEAAALAADPRLTKSDGGSFDAATGHRIMANSRGFVGEYRRSYCSISAMPIAEAEQGGMQRDYWFSSARTLARLDSPESVGAEAARRTLRRLNGRRVATQQVPIVFAPEVARSLIGNVFEAANGDSIYRSASFWTGQLGQQVASKNVTVIDDGTLPGLFGTAPFDGEGLPTRRTVIVENGVLKNYLLNTYTGRKLNMPSTGNASRALAGTPGIGGGNLFLQNGTISVQQLLADVKTGFYVTEMMGFGVNMVTGDYSRGAAGLWIENGELAFAVEEVTIAGNLKEMLNHVTAIANDLEFRGAVASPTVRIDGMTIAGK